jgi:hypothetical protein
VLGCPRIGPEGWFREHDRIVYQQKEHAELDTSLLQDMNKHIDAWMPSFLAEYK